MSDFDGLGGDLAHTLGGPPNLFGESAGDFNFDESETWILNTGNFLPPYDLVTIGAQEIGHALGYIEKDINIDKPVIIAESYHYNTSEDYPILPYYSFFKEE